MTGIKNLKEVCVFLALSLSAQQKASADNSIGLPDAGFALSPLLALPAALADVTSVPAEMKDLDPAEAVELGDAIKAAVVMNSASAEAFVEQIVDVALQLAAAALTLKNAQAA